MITITCKDGARLMTEFPWVQRCREDAAAILAYMEDQYGRGVLTFSIGKLSSALKLNRWRVYGGLVVLVQIEQSVKVTNADTDQAEFYLARAPVRTEPGQRPQQDASPGIDASGSNGHS